MNRKFYTLLAILLASSRLLANEDFVPTNPHLNIFVKNREDAPYLYQHPSDLYRLSQTQQHDYLNFIALRLGLPDTNSLLLSPPSKITWLSYSEEPFKAKTNDQIIKTIGKTIHYL